MSLIISTELEVILALNNIFYKLSQNINKSIIFSKLISNKLIENIVFLKTFSIKRFILFSKTAQSTEDSPFGRSVPLDILMIWIKTSGPVSAKNTEE